MKPWREFGRRPMGDEVTVRMNAPVEAVWDLVSDITRIGEFSPETFEAKWTKGSTGPEIGAHFSGHVKRTGTGVVYWSPCVVRRCDPHRVFAFSVGTEKAAVNTWGYRLEVVDAHTTDVTEYFRLPAAPLTRAYWFLFGRGRSRTNMHGMRTTLERMKAVLEKETPA